MGLGDERIQSGGDGGDARFPIGGQIDFFVGEVDRAFGENARVDNLSRDGARGARKIPLQSAAGGAGGGFGLRANEQIDGFGLGEVEFSVQIRAQRKLARRRPPRAQPLAARAQRGENRFAAVRVQFEQVLAGGGFWRLKIQRDSVVYDPLVGVVKPRADGDGGRRQIAPKTPVAMSFMSPPLMRTMPIAPDPGAVATATIGVESAAGADEEKTFCRF